MALGIENAGKGGTNQSEEVPEERGEVGMKDKSLRSFDRGRVSMTTVKAAESNSTTRRYYGETNYPCHWHP